MAHKLVSGSRTVFFRLCHAFGAVAVLLSFLAFRSPASDSAGADAQVKAGCLFNFVRYASWPADVLPPGATVGICSLGRTDVHQALESNFRGRKIENRPVVFRQLSDLADLAGCHVLFVSRTPSKELKTRLKSPRVALMLMVGDDDTYGRVGTLLDFSIENGRVVFIANGEAISRSRVHLSSSLLNLAKFR